MMTIESEKIVSSHFGTLKKLFGTLQHSVVFFILKSLCQIDGTIVDVQQCKLVKKRLLSRLFPFLTRFLRAEISEKLISDVTLTSFILFILLLIQLLELILQIN